MEARFIFPLHKKSQKLDVKNYGPVSDLVEIGKLVEYAVYEQVEDHFLKKQSFS